MGLESDLRKEVSEIMAWNFKVSQEKAIPSRDDLTLGKTAHEFTTAVLYADVRKSSHIPEAHRDQTAAKIFNAFLNGAVRICKQHNGFVRSFNGDSILVFFDPNNSPENVSTQAVLSALGIGAFSIKIMKPATNKYGINFGVGVGVSFGKIFATKVGIRGEDNNDIIWPCTATNLAAKMGDVATYPYSIIIGKEVYNALPEHLKWRYPKAIFLKRPYWVEADFGFAGSKINVWKTNMANDWDIDGGKLVGN